MSSSHNTSQHREVQGRRVPSLLQAGASASHPPHRLPKNLSAGTRSMSALPLPIRPPTSPYSVSALQQHRVNEGALSREFRVYAFHELAGPLSGRNPISWRFDSPIWKVGAAYLTSLTTTQQLKLGVLRVRILRVKSVLTGKRIWSILLFSLCPSFLICKVGILSVSRSLGSKMKCADLFEVSRQRHDTHVLQPVGFVFFLTLLFPVLSLSHGVLRIPLVPVGGFREMGAGHPVPVTIVPFPAWPPLPQTHTGT